MEKVKIGVIGVGNMGSSHCKTLAEDLVNHAELVAVADKREERRQWAKEKLSSVVQIFQDEEELFAAKCCDAVIIAVPHYQHPEITIKALKRGFHVLCEKPAGVYTKQVREMNEAADQSDKIFALMFNQRTDFRYRKMHELVQSGELGEIKRVNWIITDWYRTQIYYDSGDWRGTWNGEGGGVLLNQCPHQLDLLQWICGMPSKVKAYCHEGKWHNVEVEDDVTAYLEYPNGATGVFVTSTGEAPGTNRFEIDLTKGQLICENGTLTCYRMEDERAFMYSSMEGFAKPAGGIFVPEMDGESLQHTGVMQAFVDCILTGSPLIADGREGIYGLTLSNMMHLSSWTGKEICLPLDEELFLQELNKKRASSKRKENVRNVNFSLEGTYGSH